MDRCRFLLSTSALGAITLNASKGAHVQTAQAVITVNKARPQIANRIPSGDPRSDGAVIWPRGDQPAQMWLDWFATQTFTNTTGIRGPHMLEETDFAARVSLSGMPATTFSIASEA